MPWQHDSKLKVWQRAMELTDIIYRITAALPKTEIYGLCGQMRRAVVSIPSNIAEGQGRRSNREMQQFLGVARGSTFELETQLLICTRQGYLTEQQIEPAMVLCAEISRMLSAFILKLN